MFLLINKNDYNHKSFRRGTMHKTDVDNNKHDMQKHTKQDDTQNNDINNQKTKQKTKQTTK